LFERRNDSFLVDEWPKIRVCSIEECLLFGIRHPNNAYIVRNNIPKMDMPPLGHIVAVYNKQTNEKGVENV
jgi:hypothetical protein